jgi:tryptophan-rich sensory protein
MSNGLKLVAALVVCQLAGALGSLATILNISGWYTTLVKPGFNPPAWIFGPVWTTLYLMMGAALFLVWRQQDLDSRVKPALGWFAVQLLLNTLWSFLFFCLHSPLLGLVDIVLLWLAIGITIRQFFPISKPAAWLLIPYWLWVTFATVLNFEIFRLN